MIEKENKDYLNSLLEIYEKQKSIDTVSGWKQLHRRISIERNRRRFFIFIRNSAAILLPLFLAYQYLIYPILVEGRAQQEVLTVTSAPGMVIKTVLPDGSEVWLNASSTLTYPQRFTDWFQIYFVENNGMAFGIEAGGKLFLSLFRIIAVVFIIIYIKKLIKEGFKKGFIACVALILAGAFGNIIDSVFYGVIFEASYAGHTASFVPWGEGYSTLLHGKVVDMLYFPLFSGTFPNWIPFIGGEDFLFFRFIFNIADSAITVGVILLLLFYRKTLSYSLLSKSEREKYDKEQKEKEITSET
jgi:signal peptidase II